MRTMKLSVCAARDSGSRHADGVAANKQPEPPSEMRAGWSPPSAKESSGRLEPHGVGNRQRLVGRALDRLDRHEDHVLVAEVFQIVHLELAGAVGLVTRLARV